MLEKRSLGRLSLTVLEVRLGEKQTWKVERSEGQNKTLSLGRGCAKDKMRNGQKMDKDDGASKKKQRRVIRVDCNHSMSKKECLVYT